MSCLDFFDYIECVIKVSSQNPGLAPVWSEVIDPQIFTYKCLPRLVTVVNPRLLHPFDGRILFCIGNRWSLDYGPRDRWPGQLRVLSFYQATHESTVSDESPQVPPLLRYL